MHNIQYINVILPMHSKTISSCTCINRHVGRSWLDLRACLAERVYEYRCVWSHRIVSKGLAFFVQLAYTSYENGRFVL